MPKPKKAAAPKKSKAAPKIKKAKKSAAEGEYSVTLTINDGQIYNASNESLAQALVELNPEGVIKTKALITVDFNGKHFERMYMPKNIRRPLMNIMFAEILAKQINMFLQ